MVIVEYTGAYVTQTTADTTAYDSSTDSTTATHTYVPTRYRLWRVGTADSTQTTATSGEVLEQFEYPESLEYPEPIIEELINQVEDVYFTYRSTANRIRAPPGRLNIKYKMEIR